jgi:hypothetical protein
VSHTGQFIVDGMKHCDTMFNWEMRTPFGRPVVPEECPRHIRLSSSSAALVMRLQSNEPSKLHSFEPSMLFSRALGTDSSIKTFDVARPASSAALTQRDSASLLQTNSFVEYFLMRSANSGIAAVVLPGE